MRHILIAVVLLGALALAAPPAEAQVGIARGRVTDADGQALEGATVVLEFLGGVTSKFELETNKKGEYMQVGLTPGPYRVTASKEGFEAKSIQSRVNLGPATDLPRIELSVAVAAPDPEPEPAAELRETFSQAVEHLQAGRLDEAEPLFREILEAEPGLPQIHQNLAYISVQRKDWANAEASYLAALELRPNSSDLMMSLAKVYLDSGQEEKAEEMLARAAAADPADASAQYNHGLALLDAEKTAEAQAAFEAALAADPSMTEAHFQLGLILVRGGQVPEAVEHLEAYVAASPEGAPNLATAQGLLEALGQ